MKKRITAALIFIASLTFAQTTVLQTGFNGYAGTVATAPAGWFMSWHSTSSPSYYSTAGNYGLAAPSYKFGQDTVVVISPYFPGGDTLSFWCKGNGVPFTMNNELHIYHSSDSLSWTMFVNRDSLPIAGTILKYALPPTARYLMFVYRKIGTGNLGFDDVMVQAFQTIVANFSSADVCQGNPTPFADASTSTSGPVNYWMWDFGDATSSTLQNPSHTYAAAGTYLVTLIAANAGGDTDTVAINVTVYPNPVASFMAMSSTTGCDSLCVTFMDMSTISSGSIVSWNWNFGDAGSSSLQDPTHCYTSPGIYDVTLTVTSNNGCTNTVMINAMVTVNQSPTASFSYTPTGLTVNFTNTTSGGTAPYTFTFYPGDGSPPTPFVPASYTYPFDNTWVACLYVTDMNGCTDSVCVPITILTTGINEPALSPISISPNPSTGSLILDCSNLSGKIQFSVINVLGEKIFIKEITSRKSLMDLSGLPDGNYFVKIVSDAQTITSKIVISR